ncbi:RNA-binding Prp24, putative [Babesia ovata]|uniref:RNA-binding Prp24, putative n=1 Tax=Babesia ovata TaxID=189622 RepID=A0A2H6K8U8_9APIC|nr:RNA-binding Prp24, putative [Babesia ovata]GBE59411.1 RNA-binding Prp24, putative [Babesia ovata]
MSQGTGSRLREAHAPPKSERRTAAVLPAFPLPAPELCLLNARPLSCLYSSQYERTQRKRIKRALNRSAVSAAENGTDNEGGNEDCYSYGGKDVDGDETFQEATPSEIRKELQVYEALLAHIGVRIASKRNALALLGYNVLHGNKRAAFMERAAHYGVPFLPMNALVDTLQARHAHGGVPAFPDDSEDTHFAPPTDIAEGLDDIEALRGEVQDIVEDAIGRVLQEAGKDNAVGFRDLQQLPLMTSNAFSLFRASSLVLPDDVLEADLSLPTLSTPECDDESAGKAKKKPKLSEPSKPVAFKNKPSVVDKSRASPIRSVGRGIQEGETSADATPTRVARSRDQADNRGSNDRPRFCVPKGKLNSASRRICSSSDDERIASAHYRSCVSNDGDDDQADDEDEDDSDYLDSDAERANHSHRDRGRTERGDGKSKERRNEKLPPESELTVDQMVENLMNGKLCNGKDPKNLRDLVISILVAGLYEFLPVEFFNEFLQDRRLLESFRQVKKRTDTGK